MGYHLGFNWAITTTSNCGSLKIKNATEQRDADVPNDSGLCLGMKVYPPRGSIVQVMVIRSTCCLVHIGDVEFHLL